MARELTTEQMTVLEQIMDSTSAASVLEGVAYICREKADHLRTNWQDEGAAKQWDRDAKIIEGVADRVVN